MNEYQLEQELERTRQAQRLHGFDRQCVACGERNQRCLELHHVPGKGYGDDLVPVCRNCHRKLTDRRANVAPPGDPSTLDCIGHWLIGLAELLFLLAQRALEYGQALIEAAKVCPTPYGYLPAVGQ